MIVENATALRVNEHFVSQAGFCNLLLPHYPALSVSAFVVHPTSHKIVKYPDRNTTDTTRSGVFISTAIFHIAIVLG